MTRHMFDSSGGMKGRMLELKGDQASFGDDARFFTQCPQAESGGVDESRVVVDYARSRIECGQPQMNHNAGLRGIWTGTYRRQRPRPVEHGGNRK